MNAVELEEDEFEVTASDCDRLAEQSKDLSAKRRELVKVQDDTEAELRDLRARVALGKASAGDEMRRETLLERSNQQANELRELTRLIRLTDKGLSRAESLRKYELERVEKEAKQRVRDIAQSRLDGATEALTAPAVEFLAVWALSQGERSYFGARAERVAKALPRELEPLVRAAMESMSEEFSDESV